MRATCRFAGGRPAFYEGIRSPVKAALEDIKSLMNVVHSTTSLNVRNGGPPRTISQLCDHLAQSGVGVHIVSLKDGERKDLVLPEAARVTLASHSGRSGNRKAFHAALAQTLRVDQAQVLHDHGIWRATNHEAACIAESIKVPLVISPRGMLEPWALRYKAWKKKLAWFLYQHRDLRRATLLHATAFMEADNLRAIGLRQPIAVIPNGVPIPVACREQVSHQGKRRALFLSRIHLKKGIPNLLHAWRQVNPKDWELIIAGPDEGNHLRDLHSLCRQLGIAQSVKFMGPVYGVAKWDLYRSADVFVLPTFSENFGVVVAEALATGVPVITTKGTPWKELEKFGCGWWIEIGVEPLVEALQTATGMNDEDRADMGLRGRSLIKDCYGWAHVAGQMKAAYAWICGQGEKPVNVHD